MYYVQCTYAYFRTASFDNKPCLLLRPPVKRVSVEALQYWADNPLDILFYKLKQLDALAYFRDWLEGIRLVQAAQERVEQNAT